MPPYRAALGGAFGGGVDRNVPAQLDVGSIIDAIAGGAQGLIHQAYTRKQAAHAMQKQDQQLQLERDKEERQRDHEARMELASGIIRGGTSITRRPDPAGAGGAGGAGGETSPTIADAFNRGLAPAAAPTSSLERPVTEGALGRVPSLDVRTTPDRYDPNQDRTRVRALDAIGARGVQASALEDQRQQGRTDLQAARHTFKLEEQADAAADRATLSAAHDTRVTARGPGGGRGSAGSLTANGKEAAKRVLLDGLVGYHGDEQKVRSYLTEDDVGKESATKYGITDADIVAAVGRAQNHVADQVVRGTATARPERAATRVREARTAARSSGLAPAAPAAAAAGAPPAAKLPPLSDAEKKRAAQDPDYRAFKESKGYTF